MPQELHVGQQAKCSIGCKAVDCPHIQTHDCASGAVKIVSILPLPELSSGYM